MIYFDCSGLTEKVVLCFIIRITPLIPVDLNNQRLGFAEFSIGAHVKRTICPHGNTPKRKCKECIREYSKARYHKNPSLYAELSKKWRAENKEFDKERKRKWAKENPDKVSEISKRTQKKNIKKILEYLKVWRKENPEKVIEYGKRTRSKNKEKHLRITSIWRKENKKNTEYSNNRRALRMGNGGKFSAKEWEFLKNKYDYKCLCCGRKEPEIKLTIDHVIPLVRGGLHSIENIQPLCLSCNSKKGARHETDYREMRHK